MLPAVPSSGLIQGGPLFGDETRALALILSGGGQSHEADCCAQLIGLVVPHTALGLGVHAVRRAYNRAAITAVSGRSEG